jgi:pilus assembly protein Flp/PilA
MRALVLIFRKLLDDRRAATAVEYGFILALVTLALIVGVTSLGNTTAGVWSNISTKVQNAR